MNCPWVTLVRRGRSYVLDVDSRIKDRQQTGSGTTREQTTERAPVQGAARNACVRDAGSHGDREAVSPIQIGGAALAG